MLLTEIWDFQILLTTEDLHDVSSSALNLVQLLQVGKLEQGAISTLSKFKSRNERCFNQSKTKTITDKEGNTIRKDSLYIQRDSLIQIHCKQGKSESVENYRVLSFFTKTYNKWYPAEEEKFLWNDESAKKKVSVLARLMTKQGIVYREAILKAGGDWSPKQVYCIKDFKDILTLGNTLEDF